MGLSSKQVEVLDYIKKFIATKGYSPTVREIMVGLAYKSPSTVQDHLKKLVLAGLITMDKNKSRTIELLVQNEYLSTNEKIVSIPILDSVDNTVIKEFLEVPVFMVNDYDPKKLYAFREGKNIFVINSSLHIKSRPSLVIKNDKFVIEEVPDDKIFGNIISEFKIY